MATIPKTHCSKCGVLLTKENRISGRARCGECNKEHKRNHYQATRDLYLARSKNWRKNNHQRKNAYKRKYSKGMLELAKKDPVALQALRGNRRAAAIRWENGLKDRGEFDALLARRAAYENHRRKVDPQRRISTILRTQVWVLLKRQRGAVKANRTMTLVGCSAAKLVQHIESKFCDGMTWELFGRGRGKWSIDHIRPCASFNLTDPEQQKQAFHYSNLQPMWFTENCSKNSLHSGRRWSHTDHACPAP